MARAALFLESSHYRRRRLMDAVRLLPFFGLALWLVPLLWPRSDPALEDTASAISMSSAILYIFGVWAALSIIAYLLWRRTRSGDAEPELETE